MNKLVLIILSITGIIFVFPWVGAWSIVGAGHVGVVTRFGAVNRVAYPGVVIQMPLFEYVHQMDTRTQKDQVDAQAASKDLQSVKSTIAVNYHLDGSKAVEVYQNIGEDYQDKVVSPAIQETFKSITAKFTAEELITEREQVRQNAQDLFSQKMVPYHIQVDNFNIVNFDFSPEFNTAVEAKQVAQQSVEKAKLDLQRIQVEADQAKQQAQGQAEAQAALKNNGALSPEYLNYLAINKWDGHLPNVTGNGVPFINIPTK